MGSVTIVDDDPILRVTPRGYIGIRKLLDAQREAEAYATEHPDGWWHVTDGRHFVVPSPANPILLRRVRKLPHILGYVLVIPSPILAYIGRMVWRRIIAADAVVRDEQELQAWIAARTR